MSKLSKEVNKFFETATRPEISELLETLNLDDHLHKVLKMFYCEKLPVNFIAYKLNCSNAKINKDLQLIRKKMQKLNNYK